VGVYRLDPKDGKKRIFGNTVHLNRGETTVGVRAAMHFEHGKARNSDTALKLTYIFYDANGKGLNRHEQSHSIKKGWTSGYCSSQEQQLGPGSYLVRVYTGGRRVGQAKFHVVQRPTSLKPVAHSRTFKNISMKLWESSKEQKALKANAYKTVFDQDSTKFISAALYLTTTRPQTARVAFKVVSAQGDTLQRPPMPDRWDVFQTKFTVAGSYIKTERFSARLGRLLVANMDNKWERGLYYIEAFVGGKKVGEQSFRISHSIAALVDRRAAAEQLAARANQLFLRNNPADRKQGLKLVTRAIESVPDDARFYGMRAQARIQDQKLDDAAGDLERAIRLQPREKKLRLALASVQMKKESLAGYFLAVRTLTAALKLDPKDARLRAMRGMAYAKLKNYKYAEPDLRKAIAAGQRHEEVQRYLAETLIHMEQVEEALVILESLRQEFDRHPAKDNLAWKKGLAGVHQLTGLAFVMDPPDRTKALAAFNLSIETHPTARAHYLRSLLLNTPADQDKAIRDVSEAIRLDPKSYIYLERRATMWESQGRSYAALDDRVRGLDQVDSFADRINRRSALYTTALRVGDYKTARKQITVLIDIPVYKKYRGSMHRFVANAYHAEGDYAAEAKVWEKAVAEKWGDFTAQYRLAIARHLEGKNQKGAEGLEAYIQKWKSVDSKGPQGWHLALVSYILGDITEAKLLESLPAESDPKAAMLNLSTRFAIAAMQNPGADLKQRIANWQTCARVSPNDHLGTLATADLNRTILGFTPGRVSERREDLYKIDKDAARVVLNLRADSPAAKAGLQTGDILVSLDGKKLNQTVMDESLRTATPGQTMVLGLLRKGEPKTVILWAKQG